MNRKSEPHGTVRVSKRTSATSDCSVRLAYARGSVPSFQRGGVETAVANLPSRSSMPGGELPAIQDRVRRNERQ
jgi:hypothetical protein